MKLKLEMTMWSNSMSKAEKLEALNSAERMVLKTWHWEALSGIPQVRRVYSHANMLDLMVSLPEGESQWDFIRKLNHLLNRVKAWTELNEDGVEILDLEWYTMG